MKHSLNFFKLLTFTTAVALTSSVKLSAQSKDKNTAMGTSMMNHSPSGQKLDIAKIESILGIKGVEKNGEYKVTVPQNDLDIEVDGFKIIPPMGLGTWIAFTPAKDGAMIMGDIIITETDLKPVQFEVIKQGLTITAIHNHFVRNHPNVMYMHIGGSGSSEEMATKAKAVLDKVKEMRGGDPSKGPFAGRKVENTIDTKKLDSILGITGDLNNGVYKYTIGRPDAPITEHGIPISTFFGYNTWIAIQGTNDKAAIAGDFAMMEDEVAPVIKALIENGIEVVAVHNHMVQEKPRVFFLHYWAVGKAEDLVKSVKLALDKTGKKKMEMKH
ncbi:DUF1259 domain-containing protein [Elizabethkingia anophelis]|uniref:DUF1259 domain-containing protein n=1 Tax=Elizabethkingia anophelis TaxID=1117645 RepID=UPI0020B8A402|nr:DUF1259 domain-containing protein [Elizabethkingia anophelis]UTG62147.1 DUF1259 domain-containing protein [Elizabethkingia anophelis]UXM68416.1 DUF1259 domain-containing protein [Elizabethkingia anophelis]